MQGFCVSKPVVYEKPPTHKTAPGPVVTPSSVPTAQTPRPVQRWRVSLELWQPPLLLQSRPHAVPSLSSATSAASNQWLPKARWRAPQTGYGVRRRRAPAGANEGIKNSTSGNNFGIWSSAKQAARLKKRFPSVTLSDLRGVGPEHTQ